MWSFKKKKVQLTEFFFCLVSLLVPCQKKFDSHTFCQTKCFHCVITHNISTTVHAACIQYVPQQCVRMLYPYNLHKGGGVSAFPEKSGVRFNVTSVTRGERGSNSLEKSVT